MVIVIEAQTLLRTHRHKLALPRYPTAIGLQVIIIAEPVVFLEAPEKEGARSSIMVLFYVYQAESHFYRVLWLSISYFPVKLHLNYVLPEEGSVLATAGAYLEAEKCVVQVIRGHDSCLLCSLQKLLLNFQQPEPVFLRHYGQRGLEFHYAEVAVVYLEFAAEVYDGGLGRGEAAIDYL